MPTLLLAFDNNPFNDDQMARLTAALPDKFQIICSRDETIFESVRDDIEIIAGWCPRDWLLQVPHLRWFQQWAAGASWLLNEPEIAAASFTLTNVSGVHAVPISEHIFGMILSLARVLPDAHKAANDKVWARLRQPGESREKPHDLDAGKLFELDGATMMLIGVGAIGSRTAKIAKAFGMRVIGVRRRPDIQDEHVDLMIGPEAIQDHLSESDIIVLTIPYTNRTHNLLGEAEFALMKPNTVLVNIGRGGTIEENALLTALQHGKIKAAALDVFAEEPLLADSPFWDLDNLLITSHYSGGTLQYHGRAFEIFIDNIGRFFKSEPLRNVIDKREAY